MTVGKKALIFLGILVVAGSLIAFGVYNATHRQEETGIPKNAIPVQLEQPHRETVISRVSAKGTVALAEKTVIYPTTQARITQVHVKEGDTIQPGDLLLTYDTQVLDSYNDQMAEAELALRSAELALAASTIPPTQAEILQADTQILQASKAISDITAQAAQIDISLTQIAESIATARAQYADIQTLHLMGVAAKTELDNAAEAIKSLENQLETTQAQKESVLAGLPMAEENVKLAETQRAALVNRLSDPKAVNQRKAQEVTVAQAKLRLAQIQKSIDDFKAEERASVAGNILSLYAAVGDMAAAGRALMEVADTSQENLVIRVNVPEGDAKNIATGQTVEIKGAALGTQGYAGHIAKIHPLAEKKQVGSTLETVLTVEIVPDDEIMLRAGYSIDTTIITGVAEDTVVVPLMSTLSDADGTYYVYVMNPEYAVEKRIITLGEYAGIYVQATGVTEEDRLIINPSGQIKEGVYVKPIS